jgi:DNA-binding CsgD family transcriptional regulator
MSPDPSEIDPRPALWWLVGLISVAVLIGVDVVMDWGNGLHPVHMSFEVMASLVLAAIAGAMLRRREQRIGVLARHLSKSREEVIRWREEAEASLRGLGEAIDRQFERWQLSPAEREVGLLLLKGLSLKEIAELRATSERTAREQARSVYRKAGLAGRSELSAFFLEDLLLPTEPTE